MNSWESSFTSTLLAGSGEPPPPLDEEEEELDEEELEEELEEEGEEVLRAFTANGSTFSLFPSSDSRT